MQQSNWDKIWGILRATLMAVSSWFIGKQVLGQTVDENLIGVIIAALGVIGSFIWSVTSKELNLEMWQGALRNLIIGVGGVFLAFGLLKEETLPTILSLVTVLGPMIYAWLSKKKSKQLQSGKIETDQLNGNLPKQQ